LAPIQSKSEAIQYHLIGLNAYGFGVKIDDSSQLLVTHPASKLDISGLKQVQIAKMCIIGKEAWLSIYEVIKPLLVNEKSIEDFFENIILTQHTTAWDSMEFDQPYFIEIKNPNSDFRMNERSFKYNESGLKGFVHRDQEEERQKIQKNIVNMNSENQQTKTKSYIERVKYTTDDPFEILLKNPNFYFNLP
jgi:hypothetical protein